jgi:hypothetical protein
VLRVSGLQRSLLGLISLGVGSVPRYVLLSIHVHVVIVLIFGSRVDEEER